MRKSEVFTVSMPTEVRAKLKALALKEGRSVSNMVTEIVKKELQKTKAA